jgi:predicted component of type VI protein secretion system
MRKLLISLFIVVVMVGVSACSQEKKQEQPDNLVLVKGGTFMNTKSNY